MAPRNHAACVASYCDAILSGEIIAGRYLELAVRRYLDDIEHAHERGLLGFFSTSDSTGGSVDAVDEGGILRSLLHEGEIVTENFGLTVVDSTTPFATAEDGFLTGHRLWFFGNLYLGGLIGTISVSQR